MKRTNYFSLLILFIFFSCEKPCSNSPVVSAGDDVVLIDEATVELEASTDSGDGSWTILTGSGGVISKPDKSKTEFTGELDQKYSLIYTATNDCGTSSDTVVVEFLKSLTSEVLVEQLHWNQDASFRIDGAARTIYIDPQAIKNPVPADFVLITHSHGDHFSSTQIAKVCNENTMVYGPADCKYRGVCKAFVTIVPGQEVVINDFFKFKAVPAYNIVKTGYHAKASKWVGYVLNYGDVSIYHAGDTERIPEIKEIDCDIFLTPLGQTYTMNSVEDAVEATKDVKAKIAIPMHYGTNEGKVADAEKFKTLLNGVATVVIKEKE